MRSLRTRLGNLLKTCPQDEVIPERLLLMLTTPRSGSTWFADALRCHPSIQYWHTAAVYRQLGLSGRRYPRDLAGGTDGARDIEVTPGKWEKIPDFFIQEDQAGVVPAGILDNQFAIEKFHPEFYVFKTAKFLQRLAKLESRGKTIRMVYLVRDPEAGFNSFMRYQERNPHWYPSVRSKDLAVYMEKSFASVRYVAEQHQGLVIDYSDIVSDLAGTLAGIYSHIWPEQGPHDKAFNRKISQSAVTATERRKRSASGTAFLGATAGAIRGGLEKMDPFLVENRDIVASCYDSYKHLLGMHQQNE